MSKDKVLLTGVTGFLGSHVLIQLLHAGYAVRGSMRFVPTRGTNEEYSSSYSD